jgi:hypothetical protein
MSIPFEPDELLRGGEGIGVRTRRGGKVGERACDGARGLQIESGVGPTQQFNLKSAGRIVAPRKLDWCEDSSP